MSDDPILGNDPIEPQDTEETKQQEGNDPLPEDNSNGKWYEKYGEEFKGNNILDQYKDEKEALKALDHQKRLLSKKLPDIPDNESDDDQWNDLYNKLGRPESPENYEVKLTTKDNDGNEIPMEFTDDQQKVVDRLAQVAHESGMNNRQFNKALGHIIQQEQERMQEEYDPVKAEEALKKELKGGYNEFKDVAVREWQRTPDEIKSILSKVPNTERAKILHYLGSSKGEDTTPKDTQASTGVTLEDIDKEMNQIMRGDHPTHKNNYWNHMKKQEQDSAVKHYRSLAERRLKILQSKGK